MSAQRYRASVAHGNLFVRVFVRLYAFLDNLFVYGAEKKEEKTAFYYKNSLRGLKLILVNTPNPL